ncbi:UDP-N-acetylmuramoyl-tripeptide--D-alanyl-D-alanine ligase [Leucothrix pacifica]|uniref:UDP-N-acetylmuramoyl-tripeptide--D-alanyl-D-alanine ligase n=1 Tax=Leucothrix pacifica TaxID=1247513 RepID=A0A317CB47_9GAMM|nr:UDP-N-acetylmuramoyl-tripeptide--D-alanyl-D-alanine ligase [Leucothrix pacifica]PWQ95778.1 UDP-N-acetylmuramoyl-tripeptide--D-alanyl-D-alanine ligase [Leucothrix pacifica]
MTWMLSDIAKMTGGKLHGADVEIDSFATDSRAVNSDQLFIAIKGERFDAHDFVAALDGIAGAALVSELVECNLPQVLVTDTRAALASFAAAWRQQFKKPLVGLTGSNGKTTVKEMLSAILSQKGSVLATLGNLNNDLGMPLTLLRLRDEHDYAVIEMGANHFGEIKFLTGISRPDVAILNNAGAAHLEGFGSIEGVSRAKAEIFLGLDESGVAIINADDQYADYWKGCNVGREIISFGMDNAATVQGKVSPTGMLVLSTEDESVEITLSLLGNHNARNALAAASAAIAVGASLADIKAGLETLQPVKGRLASVPGQHGTRVIDDTYNANPTSAAAAVDVLAGFTAGERVLVLGDMGELGDDVLELHRHIGEYAREKNIDQLFCLGKFTEESAKAFGERAEFFTELEPLLDSLKQQLKNNMTLLVKGSRGMRMERVVEALQQEIATHDQKEASTC